MSISSFTQNIQNEIILNILSSKVSIHAAMAWLSDTKIISALIKKSQEGVSIQIIVNDDTNNEANDHHFESLRRNGVEIILYSMVKGLMHHKFCILDNKTLIVGSYNWTYSAANYNHESILILRDEPKEIQNYIDVFGILKNEMRNEEHDFYPNLDGTTLHYKNRILFLEIEITVLETELAEQERMIYEFDVMFNQQIGYLILEKRRLSEHLNERIAFLTKKNEDIAKWEASKKQTKIYEEQLKIDTKISISEIDEKDVETLKKLYRECLMMAHPDRFFDQPEKYEEANILTGILADLYKNKDFEKMKQIWQELKDGTAFKSDWSSITDIEFFEKIIDNLLRKKDNIMQFINNNNGHQAFTYSLKYQSLQEYFNVIKQKLVADIDLIKQDIKKYTS
mgnify:CR=1 FL=1|jgi:hypothetical protein